jgi:hypothetical protein
MIPTIDKAAETVCNVVGEEYIITIGAFIDDDKTIIAPKTVILNWLIHGAKIDVEVDIENLPKE